MADQCQYRANREPTGVSTEPVESRPVSVQSQVLSVSRKREGLQAFHEAGVGAG